MHRRVAHIKIYRAAYGDLTLNSPLKLKPLEAGERGGDHGAAVFFVWLCVVWFVVLGGSCRCFFSDVVTHRWWITWIWKNLRTRGLVCFIRLHLFYFEIVSTYAGCSIKIRWRFFLVNLSYHLNFSLYNLKIGQRMFVGIRFQYQKDDFKKYPQNQIYK